MKTKSSKELRRILRGLGGFIIVFFRWILRGLGGLLIAFFLFMFIGETFSAGNSGEPLTANAILQLSITGVGFIGLGLAWKWELIGGIIALVSYFVLAIINPTILGISLMLLWPLTAILFIVLWAISRKTTIRNK